MMSTIPRVRKAVFPVAGLGTRFLPATKAMPKEMLPVVDKPLIQYAVEEAAAAGIKQMIFVTGRHKSAIEDHFDRAPELEAQLHTATKHELYELLMSATPSGVSFVYLRQPEPLGLGHAVLCARDVVGNEPFAVILADDLIDANPGVTAQLIESYQAHSAAVLAVENVPLQDTGKYGIVATRTLNSVEERVISIVEKPKPAEAPSTLAVVGRYILHPEVFSELEVILPDHGGEIQLTDAIARSVVKNEIIARRFTGTRYDCGSKAGWLQANVALGHKAGFL